MHQLKQPRKSSRSLKPNYHGKRWISVRLPNKARDWSHGSSKSIVTDSGGIKGLVDTLSHLNRVNAWRWPKRRHFFFSDLHADAEAFAASLVASGGVKKHGPAPLDFTLTTGARHSNFVIGGDCFDKGPNNLELLRTVRHLKKQGARVRILAGNHDIRLLFGMRVVGKKKDVHNEHFFIRTGQKIIPLLREIWDEYLENGKGLKGIPSESGCRERLLPRANWFKDFQKIDRGDILPAQMEREVSRITKKMERFEPLCKDAGLSMRQVYAAVRQWKALFLANDGEFRWFYKNMRLCFRSGSHLYVHAGIDDEVAHRLYKEGVHQLNVSFRQAMSEPPFDFYYGALCNTIRTKYRDVDRPLTKKGVRDISRAGITTIIHGHRNLHFGQRLSLRKSLINFECDTSLDRHTRSVEQVVGRGASVTIVEPRGYLLGISSDFPYIKVFHPERTLSQLKNNYSG